MMVMMMLILVSGLAAQITFGAEPLASISRPFHLNLQYPKYHYYTQIILRTQIASTKAYNYRRARRDHTFPTFLSCAFLLVIIRGRKIGCTNLLQLIVVCYFSLYFYSNNTSSLEAGSCLMGSSRDENCIITEFSSFLMKKSSLQFS